MDRKRRKSAEINVMKWNGTLDRPQRDLRAQKSAENRRFCGGGEGWIRTSVRLRGQIYSLLPLTTRPPLQVRQARHVAARPKPVNAFHGTECRAPLAAARALQNSTSLDGEFWSG